MNSLDDNNKECFHLQICSGKVDVHVVKGDHESFILGEGAQQIADILSPIFS